jgi:hypothetical protein
MEDIIGSYFLDEFGATGRIHKITIDEIDLSLKMSDVSQRTAPALGAENLTMLLFFENVFGQMRTDHASDTGYKYALHECSAANLSLASAIIAQAVVLAGSLSWAN